jgi:hypothetical protein
MFVASNRHLLAIRTGSSGSASAAGSGTVITSTVAVHRNGQLDQQSETEDGQDCSSTVQVQATVAAVGAGTITLVVNGQDITVNLPGGLTLPQSLVSDRPSPSTSPSGKAATTRETTTRGTTASETTTAAPKQRGLNRLDSKERTA